MSKIPVDCLEFRNGEEWRRWLDAHHAAEGEAWLLISRTGSAHRFLALEDAIDEALCYGWIQAALQPIDKGTYALRFSPRKPDSIWSVNNQRRVEQLIQLGRMTPAGMAKVNEAKASGEWEAAIARQDVSSVPDDLVQALEEEDAWLEFESWPASQKIQYLYWLEIAKRPETREKRIKTIVERSKRGKVQRDWDV